MPDPQYEPVGYRYRRDGEPDDMWCFALPSEHEAMETMAEKGWQVERLYRRESDTEVEGE